MPCPACDDFFDVIKLWFHPEEPIRAFFRLKQSMYQDVMDDDLTFSMALGFLYPPVTPYERLQEFEGLRIPLKET